jgi:hypothetical protein
MAHARINKAAQLKASELPAHFDTFEAKSAKDFSKSTIPMNYLSADRLGQSPRTAWVPLSRK